MAQLQKTRFPGFLKDPKTNFVHNTNWENLKAYRLARAQFLANADLKLKNEQINNELQDLKALLKAKGII